MSLYGIYCDSLMSCLSLFYDVRSMEKINKAFKNDARNWIEDVPVAMKRAHFWNTVKSWDETGWEVFLLPLWISYSSPKYLDVFMTASVSHSPFKLTEKLEKHGVFECGLWNIRNRFSLSHDAQIKWPCVMCCFSLIIKCLALLHTNNQLLNYTKLTNCLFEWSNPHQLFNPKKL